MAIVLRLDRMMADRKVSLGELAEKVGIADGNLSKLKNGKVSGVRFKTLNAICKELDCRRRRRRLILPSPFPRFLLPWRRCTRREGRPMRMLLVEDDAAIVASLTDLLRSEGYETRCADGQDAAVELLRSERFDLALVDVALAQGNGFAVCAAAKACDPAPAVIFLTASDDEFSTVAGLDMGADDYIAKPFRARELLSRIRSVLRRTNAASSLLRLGDVEIDAGTACVRKAGRDLALTALEYRLLLLFAQSRGKLVTREHVRNAIWDSAGEYVSDNTLSVYVKRLRDKVEDDPAEPRLILTVRGLGYRTGA